MNGGTLSYIQQDSLGSTSVTSDINGNSTSAIRYLPFGDCRFSTGNIPTDEKFTGQRLDSTGLYYYNARYYDPTIGRFISPDTIVQRISNPQTLNRYSYCSNNPLKYVDPSGHGWWSVVTDIASIAFDVYQLSSDPSWGNAGFLALDVTLTCLPIIPAGVGPLAKGIKTIAQLSSKGEKIVEGVKNIAEVARTARAGIESASLGNKEARLWYINRLKQIPDMIDKSLPLEEQAKQAFELRNSFKAETRDLMLDKESANYLDIMEPPKTWETLYNDAVKEGKTGNDIYQSIIESSQRTRASVNSDLGLIEGIDY